MAKVTAPIRFKARLLRPAKPADADWLFFVLPEAASNAFPTRSQVSVDGALAGQPFQVTLDPDGKGSHWMKVEAALAEAKKAVESNDAAQINAQFEALTKASHKIAEALYQQQTAGGSASGAGASGAGGAGATGGANKSAGGDDVIDAEYIDVDENK